MKTNWADATADFAAGDTRNTLLKASFVKQEGTYVLQKLGMALS